MTFGTVTTVFQKTYSRHVIVVKTLLANAKNVVPLRKRNAFLTMKLVVIDAPIAAGKCVGRWSLDLAASGLSIVALLGLLILRRFSLSSWLAGLRP